MYHVIKASTHEEPRVWPSKLIGFGIYHYKYESGREGNWFLKGFSSNKNYISIYRVAGVNNYSDLLSV